MSFGVNLSRPGKLPRPAVTSFRNHLDHQVLPLKVLLPAQWSATLFLLHDSEDVPVLPVWGHRNLTFRAVCALRPPADMEPLLELARCAQARYDERVPLLCDMSHSPPNAIVHTLGNRPLCPANFQGQHQCVHITCNTRTHPLSSEVRLPGFDQRERRRLRLFFHTCLAVVNGDAVEAHRGNLFRLRAGMSPARPAARHFA
mmetsp:Transcript_38722/g.89776  ORF Transcript_38722/g.89776 Transcript_38722/m.89776 type:complete len:201 (+) Transcript_38722:182-784(+)